MTSAVPWAPISVWSWARELFRQRPNLWNITQHCPGQFPVVSLLALHPGSNLLAGRASRESASQSALFPPRMVPGKGVEGKFRGKLKRRRCKSARILECSPPLVIEFRIQWSLPEVEHRGDSGWAETRGPRERDVLPVPAKIPAPPGLSVGGGLNLRLDGVSRVRAG